MTIQTRVDEQIKKIEAFSNIENAMSVMMFSMEVPSALISCYRDATTSQDKNIAARGMLKGLDLFLTKALTAKTLSYLTFKYFMDEFKLHASDEQLTQVLVKCISDLNELLTTTGIDLIREGKTRDVQQDLETCREITANTMIPVQEIYAEECEAAQDAAEAKEEEEEEEIAAADAPKADAQPATPYMSAQSVGGAFQMVTHEMEVEIIKNKKLQAAKQFGLKPNQKVSDLDPSLLGQNLITAIHQGHSIANTRVKNLIGDAQTTLELGLKEIQKACPELSPMEQYQKQIDYLADVENGSSTVDLTGLTSAGEKVAADMQALIKQLKQEPEAGLQAEQQRLAEEARQAEQSQQYNANRQRRPYAGPASNSTVGTAADPSFYSQQNRITPPPSRVPPQPTQYQEQVDPLEETYKKLSAAIMQVTTGYINKHGVVNARSKKQGLASAESLHDLATNGYYEYEFTRNEKERDDADEHSYVCPLAKDVKSKFVSLRRHVIEYIRTANAKNKKGKNIHRSSGKDDSLVTLVMQKLSRAFELQDEFYEVTVKAKDGSQTYSWEDSAYCDAHIENKASKRAFRREFSNRFDNIITEMAKLQTTHHQDEEIAKEEAKANKSSFWGKSQVKEEEIYSDTEYDEYGNECDKKFQVKF